MFVCMRKQSEPLGDVGTVAAGYLETFLSTGEYLGLFWFKTSSNQSNMIYFYSRKYTLINPHPPVAVLHFGWWKLATLHTIISQCV